MDQRETSILTVDSLSAGYDRRTILQEISFAIPGPEILAIIGHNGAGKSTLLRALVGLSSIFGGTVTFAGLKYDRGYPLTLLHRGLVFLPQSNNVFDRLTVKENIDLCRWGAGRGATPAAKASTALEFFPQLANRTGELVRHLSGGERRMLALACTLLYRPKLLLLDEPSIGLAPKLCTELFDRIKELPERYGTAVIVVEQNVKGILQVAQRALVLRNGLISYQGPCSSLNRDVLQRVFI